MALYAVGYANGKRELCELGAVQIERQVGSDEFLVEEIGGISPILNYEKGLNTYIILKNILFFTKELSTVEYSIAKAKLLQAEVQIKKAEITKIESKINTLKSDFFKEFEDCFKQKEVSENENNTDISQLSKNRNII